MTLPGASAAADLAMRVRAVDKHPRPPAPVAVDASRRAATGGCALCQHSTADAAPAAADSHLCIKKVAGVLSILREHSVQC